MSIDDGFISDYMVDHITSPDFSSTRVREAVMRMNDAQFEETVKGLIAGLKHYNRLEEFNAIYDMMCRWRYKAGKLSKKQETADTSHIGVGPTKFTVKKF